MQCCYFLLMGLVFLTTFDWVKCAKDCSKYTFDDSIKFGVATSAYQIEGAWNESGKSFNIWDFYSHNTDVIRDGSTGDIACDSYHKYKEDIALIKSLGVKEYRFSIAWSRILPEGMKGTKVNQAAVDFYDNFINELIQAGIDPVVTIYHWDHPWALEFLSSWYSLNSDIVEHITYYADLLFSYYGDRVKTWVTLNEPHSYCSIVTRVFAQANGAIQLGTDEYVCGHNMLLAHSKIWALYQEKYKSDQKGKIGVALSVQTFIPATDSEQDELAAERLYDYTFGWFLSPLVFGDYPGSMIEGIQNYSLKQGLKESRLPRFTSIEQINLTNSFDFIGLNNYVAYYITANDTVEQNPSASNDLGANLHEDPAWTEDYEAKIKVYTQGFRKILKDINRNYGNFEIKITEQGYNNASGLNDQDRVLYLKLALQELWGSINEDKIPVTSFFFWSLMDDFEWFSGYTVKMGLYEVDFNDPERPRTAKASAGYYKKFLKEKCITT